MGQTRKKSPSVVLEENLKKALTEMILLFLLSEKERFPMVPSVGWKKSDISSKRENGLHRMAVADSISYLALYPRSCECFNEREERR